MYNSVTIIGTVGKDFKVNDAGNGNKMANLSICSWEYKKGEDGKRYKRVTWHDVLVYGSSVSSLVNISKGDTVLVTGKIAAEKNPYSQLRQYVVGYVRLVKKKYGSTYPHGEIGNEMEHMGGIDAIGDNESPSAMPPSSDDFEDISDLRF